MVGDDKNYRKRTKNQTNAKNKNKQTNKQKRSFLAVAILPLYW